jgi:hypothetical protein
MGATGKVLEPKAWCRKRECRERPDFEHGPGDGCSCHPLGATEARVLPAPRLTVLRARAMRLSAFACRACGRAAKRMVECPELFFRCEECASEDRWPTSYRRMTS